MNIERALATPGWMDLSELVYLAHLAEKSQAIVEIGTWQGRSMRALADNTPGIVFCVDTWADDSYGDAPAEMTCTKNWLWNAFNRQHEDVLHRIAFPIRMTSVQAAEIMSGTTFDMVFIDGGHNYEDVIADIKAWRPLLNPGGVLCGHDLYPNGPHHPGVLQAVNELIGDYSVVGTIWMAK